MVAGRLTAFARRATIRAMTKRKLSPATLGNLAAQLPGVPAARAAKLTEQIVTGFYGARGRTRNFPRRGDKSKKA